MIDFGSTLRLAREAKGLTLSDIAEKTHIMVQIVEDLENEDFTRIPAPIYGRGFVKLYCEAVGIADPRVLINEFMAIYNGNRAPVIRMRPTTPPPAPTPAPAAPAPAEPAAPVAPTTVEPAEPVAPTPAPAEPVAAPPPEPVPSAPVAPTPVAPPPPEPAAPAAPPAPAPEPAPAPFEPTHESFSAPVPLAPREPPARVEEPPFRLDAGEITRPRPAAESRPRTPSRYVPPRALDENDERPAFRMPEIPPFVWRLCALAVACGIILYLAFVGVRALYRLTMTAPKDDTPAVQQPAPAPGPSSAAPAAKRTPLPVKPLYID